MDNTSTALSIVPESHNRQLTSKDLHGSWLSVEAILARQKKTAEIVETLMVEGEHFGKIEGCGDDKSLLKPGAELLAFVFGLAPEFVVKHVDLGNGHREVIITCRMLHQATGTFLGSGLGSCSTMEKKYRWRGGGLTCPDCEFPGALTKSKREPEYFCWGKKGGCGATFALDDTRVTSQSTQRMENPDIADVYNTVLKMAVKRAQVAATLTVCSCSNVLKQDLEDLSDEELADRRAREARKNAGKTNGNGQRDVRRENKPQQPAAAATPREKTPEELEHEQLVKDWYADLAEAQNELDMRKIGERGRALSPKNPQAESAFWRPFWERAHKLNVTEALRRS